MPDDIHTSTVSSELSSLIHRVARGDKRAFALLYDETAPRVFGLALRVLRDGSQAEEVARETYVEIWRRAGRFDARRETAIAWMMSIAHTKAVTRARAAPATTPNEPGTVDSPTGATRVGQALLQLPPIHRECLEMTYLNAHTHGEVAGLLDLAKDAVSARLRTGLLQLRDLV